MSAQELAEPKQKFAELKKAAGQGDGDAQLNLGYLYYFGHGVRVDYRKARMWFERAAEQDLPAAQWALAMLYLFGHGVHQDYKQAFYWYKKSGGAGTGGRAVQPRQYVQQRQRHPSGLQAGVLLV